MSPNPDNTILLIEESPTLRYALERLLRDSGHAVTTARRAIVSIRDLGCRFSLDDFGTGFSSFSQMKQLPVDYIKIDGMFVQAMATDPIDQAMVNSMNDIAHCLGRQTVAEYVNNRDILRLLIQSGVDHAQGHYIARPLEDPAVVGDE